MHKQCQFITTVACCVIKLDGNQSHSIANYCSYIVAIYATNWLIQKGQEAECVNRMSSYPQPAALILLAQALDTNRTIKQLSSWISGGRGLCWQWAAPVISTDEPHNTCVAIKSAVETKFFGGWDTQTSRIGQHLRPFIVTVLLLLLKTNNKS